MRVADADTELTKELLEQVVRHASDFLSTLDDGPVGRASLLTNFAGASPYPRKPDVRMLAP